MPDKRRRYKIALPGYCSSGRFAGYLSESVIGLLDVGVISLQGLPVYFLIRCSDSSPLGELRAVSADSP